MTQRDRHFDHLDALAEHPSPLLYEKGRTICLALVILGAIGVIFGALMAGRQFYFSWLTGWAFCWCLMMGVLFFVLLHYLTGAGWDTVIRRPAEQLLSAMPVIVLGLIPIVIGMVNGQLYEWVHPDPAHPLLGFRAIFLSVKFALCSLAVCAVVWLWLAYVLRRNSIRQDADGDARWTISSRRWASGGILLYGLSLTAASLHLLMSLDSHWFSTIFGVVIWSSGLVGGLSLMSLLTLKLRQSVLRQYIGSDTVHDIAKLTFAFSCFWAYVAFSQYFLIWYGNIPEETIWFLHRWTGTDQPAVWWPLGLLFPTGMFVVPFLLLMSAAMKRNARMLASMCILMIVSHFIQIYWIVQPESGTPEARTLAPQLSWIWIDLSVVLLLGGLCGMVFITNFRKVPMFPIMDPHLVEALSAEHVEEIEQADVE